jgi:hypothetical protein
MGTNKSLTAERAVLISVNPTPAAPRSTALRVASNARDTSQNCLQSCRPHHFSAGRRGYFCHVARFEERSMASLTEPNISWLNRWYKALGHVRRVIARS